jgi:hypothetical protein
MNCPYCGTSNLDNATLCIQCGRPLTAAPPPPPPPPPLVQATYLPPPPPAGSYAPPAGGYSGGPVQPRIPNYLVLSIILTICCCSPFGLVGIIFAAQVNSKLRAGDVAGAQHASKIAKIFCILGVVFLILGIVVGVLTDGAGILEGLRQGYHEGLNR